MFEDRGVRIWFGLGPVRLHLRAPAVCEAAVW